MVERVRVVAAIGGIALIAGGVGMLNLPASLIVTGCLLLGGAVYGALRAS